MNRIPAAMIKKQKGIALMMFAVLLVITASVIVFKNVNPASQDLEQQQNSFQALAEAKAALMAYAISGDTPGQLPCPENTALIGTATEGSALSSCNTEATRIGRLPWRTLGISQLKDAAGEPLWYVLSDGFRSVPINSETAAQLSLDGVAGSAVAIVFAPGTTLSGQSRSTVDSAHAPAVANYLDLGNADVDAAFVKLAQSSNFNDQLAVITPAEFFQQLERRVLNEIQSYMATYKNTWNAYPFPASYPAYPTTPGNLLVDSFDGNTAELGGLLPISDPGVTYINASHTYQLVDNSSGATISGTCTSAASRIRCNASIPSSGAASRSWTGTANIYFANIGKGFIDSNLSLADFSTTSTTGSYIRPTTSTTRFTVTKTSLSKSINSAGNAILTVVFNVSRTTSTSTTLRFQLDVEDYPDTTSPWVNTATSWLMTNNWYRLIYYRPASLYLPSGRTTLPICADNCLIISKTASNGTVSTSINIPGVIMSAGRSLSGQNRANGTMTDYFDTVNNQNAENTETFDERTLISTTFNDQLKVLEP